MAAVKHLIHDILYMLRMHAYDYDYVAYKLNMSVSDVRAIAKDYRDIL
jgi:uncharacterized protein YfkK (UPF0435 family)